MLATVFSDIVGTFPPGLTIPHFLSWDLSEHSYTDLTASFFSQKRLNTCDTPVWHRRGGFWGGFFKSQLWKCSGGEVQTFPADVLLSYVSLFTSHVELWRVAQPPAPPEQMPNPNTWAEHTHTHTWWLEGRWLIKFNVLLTPLLHLFEPWTSFRGSAIKTWA